MPPIKKTKHSLLPPLINRKKAIQALDILVSESQGYDTSSNKFSVTLSQTSDYLQRAFVRDYGHTCKDTLREILMWSPYIFPNGIILSTIEIYRRYEECLSTISQKQTKEPVQVHVCREGNQVSRKPQSSSSNEWLALDISWDSNRIELSASERYWLYQGFRYDVDPRYSDEEARLLILEDFDKERQKFERLRAKFDEAPASVVTYDRPRIPENVRIEVWRRDGGKCARCGSRERLEYDHIVPISRGGSNTARNIELLCETCNRAKSNNIA